VNAAGAGGCQAYSETTRIFGIAARREGSRFLVPYLNELNIFLMRAESLKDAVDSVSRESEDCVNAPIY
jgi:hypothetical protein